MVQFHKEVGRGLGNYFQVTSKVDQRVYSVMSDVKWVELSASCHQAKNKANV